MPSSAPPELMPDARATGATRSSAGRADAGAGGSPAEGVDERARPWKRQVAAAPIPGDAHVADDDRPVGERSAQAVDERGRAGRARVALDLGPHRVAERREPPGDR